MKIARRAYLFQATLAGNQRNGSIYAYSQALARWQLERQGWCDIQWQTSTRQTPRVTLSAPNKNQLSQALQRLALLLQAGLSIEAALAEISAESSFRSRGFWQYLTQQVSSGANLSQILHPWQRSVGPTTLALIRAGEASGQLIRALNASVLLQQYEQQRQLRWRQLWWYPRLVVVTLIAVINFSLLWLVPQLMQLQADERSDTLLFRLSVSWHEYALPVTIGLSAVVILLAVGHQLRGAWQRWRTASRAHESAHEIDPNAPTSLPLTGSTWTFKEYLLLRVPFLGQIHLLDQCWVWTHSLLLMSRAGIEIKEALGLLLTQPMPATVTVATQQWQQRLNAGEHWSVALTALASLPRSVSTMLRFSAERANLEQHLPLLAQRLEEDRSYLMARYRRIIEPSLLIVLGSLILGLFAMIYLPLLNFQRTI